MRETHTPAHARTVTLPTFLVISALSACVASADVPSPAERSNAPSASPSPRPSPRAGRGSVVPDSAPRSTDARPVSPQRGQQWPTAPIAPSATPRAEGIPVATLTPIVRDRRDPSSAVDALVSTFVSADQPGMAVLVMRHGETLHARGYGLADLDSRTRIDARTVFRLASVSKQFTAMAIMMLAEEGALSYDDPLSRFLPDVVAGHRARRTVTIRHLLEHTSGIPDYLDHVYDDDVDEADIDTADVVRHLASWRAHTFAPGTRYEYSNSNYVLLAAVAERATGRPFGAFLRERIVSRLRMPTAIVFDDPALAVPGRARGYDTEGSARTRSFELDDSNSPVLGDDGIFASLEDFVRWEAALRSEQLVRRATLDRAFTSGRLRNGEETGYGFGWEIEGDDARRIVSHDGSWAGFRTSIVRNLADGLTVVVLSNRGDTDPDQIAADVMALYVPSHRS